MFSRLSSGHSRYLPDAALYSTAPSGGHVRRLTPIAGPIVAVAASGDGRKIAYDAETYGYGKDGKDRHVTGDLVHVMNANGSHNRTVYHCPASACSSLTWSPVGNRLLVNGDIVLEPDGHLRRLCTGACGPNDTLSGASWSPDGREIAFEDSVQVTTHDGSATISAIGSADADGAHARLLTDRQCTSSAQSQCTYDSEPTWAPAGHEIAFQRLRSTFLTPDGSRGLGPQGPTGIDVMRSDGTDITQLTSCGSQCRYDSILWAPDGVRLAFVDTATFATSSGQQGAIGVADTSTHRVDIMSVRTLSSPNDQSLVPAVAWTADGRELLLDNREAGGSAAIDLVPVDDTALGAPSVVVRRDAYPPLTWLPTP